MARLGGMTALRAALGGVSGGLRGLGEMREARRAEEEQRRAAERQRLQDEERTESLRLARELAVRKEQREARDAGMMPASQFNPRGIGMGMDMPGATPREPVLRQRIGDEELVMAEDPKVAEHRAGLFKRREERLNAERMGDVYEATGLAPKGQGRMISRMPTSAQQVALNAVQAAERARREAREFDRREGIRARRTRAEGGARAGGGEATPKGPAFENTKYTALERALSRAEDALQDAEEGSPEQAALRERVKLLRDNLTRVQEEQGIVRQPPPTPDAIPAGARFGGSYRAPATDQEQMQQAIKSVQDDPDLTFEEKMEAMREIQAAAAARRRQPRTP